MARGRRSPYHGLMPWYDYKAFQRHQTGRAGRERPELTATFEAADETAAKSEAYRRTRLLPPNHFAALRDEAGTQIWEDDSPNA